jgi:hypothetical protein
MSDRGAFTFAYEAEGTRVLDCALPNRGFTVTVEPASRTVDVAADDGAPIARQTPEGLWIAARVVQGPVDAEWIRAAAGDSRATSIFGPDLARYLRPDAIPASPLEYLRGLVVDASTIEPGDGPHRWVLTFDAVGSDPLAGLRVDATVSDDRVERITASGTSQRGVPVGFTITSRSDPVLFEIGRSVALAALDPSALRSIVLGCEL